MLFFCVHVFFKHTKCCVFVCILPGETRTLLAELIAVRVAACIFDLNCGSIIINKYQFDIYLMLFFCVHESSNTQNAVCLCVFCQAKRGLSWPN